MVRRIGSPIRLRAGSTGCGDFELGGPDGNLPTEMRPKSRRPIRTMSILVFQEGEWLCARWLEHDLAVQAKTLSSLYVRLHRMIVGHIAVRFAHGQRPFEDLPPAPRKYRDMFNRSKITLPPQLFSFGIKNRAFKIPTPKVRVAA